MVMLGLNLVVSIMMAIRLVGIIVLNLGANLVLGIVTNSAGGLSMV